MIPSNPFLSATLEQVPRLLGQLNRNLGSRTYGSFDRAYWHYRTNDISCARYQEAVLTLALLYTSDFSGNIYYHDDQILDWIRASLRFTASLQRSDGSFDEWYPNEGSYVGTAFATAALGQTVSLLKAAAVSVSELSLITKTIKRAAVWLTQAEEATVMNQVAGAIFALAIAARVTGESQFDEAARQLEKRLLAEQNREGWWPEYGGPDIGYLSLAVSYLEKYQRLTGSQPVAAAILKAKTFVETFVNPDRTAGGEYMTRNTEYLIPSITLPYLEAIKPGYLDDRYLCYILYNWIETGLQLMPQTIKLFPGEDCFPESKILRVVNQRYFLVANGQKGGSLRLYAASQVYYDSGLELDWHGCRLSSGLFDPQNAAVFGDNSLAVSGFFKPIKEPLMKTKLAVPFKLSQLIFGRFSFYQKLIKRFLRPRMISYREPSPVGFERQIIYKPNQIEIRDTIKAAVNKNQVYRGLKASYLAVPSSKYFIESELAKNRLEPVESIQEKPDALVITRSFKFN